MRREPTAGFFRVHPEVFALLGGLRVVAVEARAIGPGSAGLEEFWAGAWSGLRESYPYPNAQSHPRIAAWRRAMKRIGAPHKEFPTSVESLVRRALKGAAPFHVHPLVDFYNAVCLRHVAPAGGFDIEALAGDLELRLTVEGDTFQALDAEAAEPVPPGEVAYACGARVLTRHLMWRQSRQALIRPETRRAIFVSEVLPGDEGLAERIASDLVGGLRDLFAADAAATILDAGRPWLPLGSATSAV